MQYNNNMNNLDNSSSSFPKQISLFDRVGGHETFKELVHYFYEHVSEDKILRPMYEEDLAPAEERLLLFLEQFFGGPHTYSQRRGHPRLRMRHMPFTIDQAASQAWLDAMDRALARMEGKIPEAEELEMRRYFSQAANFLINTPG